jgi:hypothetical protein
MTVLNLFKKAVSALKNYVVENTSFSVEIDVSSYPVKVTFYEETRQMTIEDEATDCENASVLQFVFYDKMTIKTQEDFHISEEVFNKLKTLSKEVNRLYLNAFFEKFDGFRKNITQSFNRCNGIDKIGKSSESWDKKEFFLAVVHPQAVVDSLVDMIEVEVE